MKKRIGILESALTTKKKLFKGRNKSIKVTDPVRLASSSLFIFG